MAEMPFFPLATDAFLADTDHLDDAERGRYVSILIALWRAPKQRLPNDDAWLAKKFKRGVDRVQAELRPVIAEFCQCDGNWITQKRLSKEYDFAKDRTEKRRAGAQAKWQAEQLSGEAFMSRRERDALNRQKRSARLAAARTKASHTKEEWAAMVAIFNHRCVFCGGDGQGDGGIVKDHIVPIYRGGSDGIDNLQPSCQRCNARKGPDDTDMRQAIDPKWKERLQRRLRASALTPTLIPTQESSSEISTVAAREPSVSGALSTRAKKPPTMKEQMEQLAKLHRQKIMGSA